MERQGIMGFVAEIKESLGSVWHRWSGAASREADEIHTRRVDICRMFISLNGMLNEKNPSAEVTKAFDNLFAQVRAIGKPETEPQKIIDEAIGTVLRYGTDRQVASMSSDNLENHMKASLSRHMAAAARASASASGLENNFS